MKRFRKIRSSRGFTLIELLVVIVIIAILAGGIILLLNSARKRAADNTLQDSLSKTAEAVAAFRAEDTNDKYPSTLNTIRTSTTATVKLPNTMNDAVGQPIGYSVNDAVARTGYITWGQRSNGDYYFVKDNDKCFKDGATLATPRYDTTCP